MTGVPISLMTDVTAALIVHGVKTIHQEHMNRLVVLFSEMLASQEEQA
jgi:hypothetical protein